ncbi:hypothetical protein [Streptomyces sp. NPDC057302]|uniref:hypothetical protein n=1 Tax=Streptomyces sp. NPDC057302 TaxID=3346094 RepID=UPI00362D584F
MRAFKRWFDRSLTAQAILLFPLGVGFAALFRRNEHPVVWVIQGVLYTAAIITFVAVQRRRASRAAGTDARGIVELNRKIRHREVPREPAERATMRRLVAQQLGQIERGRRWLPFWLGSMLLLAVGMLVLGATTGSLAIPLVSAGGLIGLCLWALWMRRRSLDRFRHMHTSLQS